MARRITTTINRIRCHTTDQVPTRPGAPTATIAAIDDLLARLEQLVTIDDNAPSAIDGYPTKTPGARPPEATGLRLGADGMPAPVGDVDDELVIEPDPDGWYVLGHLPSPPDTTVETAALQLAEHGNPRDIVHRLRLQAEAAAETVARELTVLAGTLARYDKIRLPLPLDTPQCWVAAVVHGLPLDVKWVPGQTGKRTTFAGVIDFPWRTERQVCRWTYDFTRRWRRLPTKDEMLEYLATGKVLINETVETRRAS